MFALANRPQSIGKTLDSGFKLFFAGFGRVFVLALVAAFVANLPSIVLGTKAQVADAEALRALGWKILALFLVAMILATALNTAILRRLALLGNGAAADDSISKSIAIGFKYLLPVFAGFILYGIAVGAGMILLIVPGIFLLVSLYLFWPAIVVEGKGPIEALKRSYNLVRGNWWRTLTVMSIPIFLLIAFYFAAMFVIGIVLGVTSGGDATALTTTVEKTALILHLLEVPVNAVSLALFYAVLVVLYHDLKLRKEGGDLEARLARA